MFGTFSDQLKKSAEPVHSLIALNAKTLETLSGYQTALFTGLLNDSANYLKTVNDAPDVKHVLAAHSECAESMQERIVSATQDTYHILNQLRDDVTGMVRSSLSSAAETTQAQAKEVVKMPQKVAAQVATTGTEATDSAATQAATSATKSAAAAKKTSARASKTASKSAGAVSKKSQGAAKTATKRTEETVTSGSGAAAKPTENTTRAASDTAGATTSETSKSAPQSKRASTAKKSGTTKPTK